ncbi:hypothetical protein [Candidatus Borreliella tachyglossi]|uniref:hypothetical protein n=1 Tax=Candidatus Borreliella tachyglossi TaxID=1964448 RepID=UPI00404391A5
MKIKILCTILLMISTVMLFSDEYTNNTFKLSSNVEEEIIGTKLKHKYKKDATSINQSNAIRYPETQKAYHYDITDTKDSILAARKHSTCKKKIIGTPTNNPIEIRESGKVQYPYDKVNTQTSKSDNIIWYNIKVYPNHKKDKFKKIKTINEVNVQIEKDFALIGPVLEDNLGTITKILAIKGYNSLEYIKIKQN